MSKYLNSTAAILVILVMADTAHAQDVPICDLDDLSFPCSVEGEVFENQGKLRSTLGGNIDLGTDDLGTEVETLVEAPTEETADDAQVEEMTQEPIVEDTATDIPVEEAPADQPLPSETDATPEADVEVDADIEAALEAEMQAEAETETPAEAEAEAQPEVETEAEAETQAEPDTETEAETDMDTATEAQVAGDEITEPAQTAIEGEVEIDPEALADETPTAPEDTVEETTATAATVDSQAGTVEEETVSDEDVRSADEDFETSVSADRSVARDDSGLSNFERALLIGLGAIAIGSILDNGDEVVSNSGDRIVLQQPDGTFRVLKDDDVLLRQPGSNVRVERFDDGSSRTFVTQADGTEVVTIRSAEGRVLRRALLLPDGSQVELFDDTRAEQTVDVSTLPLVTRGSVDTSMTATQEELRAALQAEMDVERTFSLRQVRTIAEVRELAPLVELDTLTFQTGSAAIQPDQARDLVRLGTAINDIVRDRPGAVFLIEGHTDAVGSASYNLALSDRRAETVALALTEYFDVPAANLVTQGYGETSLKVRTLEAEEANRRASVRNITQLLR